MSRAEKTLVHCECGECTGMHCEWTGNADETVVVEYVPAWLREQHTAAGNYGVYPHNGAIRVRVERECAERLVQYEPEWAEVVS